VLRSPSLDSSKESSHKPRSGVVSRVVALRQGLARFVAADGTTSGREPPRAVQILTWGGPWFGVSPSGLPSRRVSQPISGTTTPCRPNHRPFLLLVSGALR
jgi:hypothetical protein